MRKLTIKDIAELSNTSKTTVSFYLNGKTEKMSEETKQRIAKVIAENHYSPSVVARSLNAKSMRLIGVIIGDITNTFANQIVKGIDDVARDKKYQLIVGNSNYQYENEEQYVERMIAMGVDGFIVQPTIEFEKIAQKLEEIGKPVVYIDSQIRGTKGLWVKTNNYEAVLEASDLMIEKGYEEFIMISADPSVLTTRMERANGFLDNLKIKNKKCETMIVDNQTSSAEIEAFLDHTLDTNKKTCIFAPNCWVLPKVYLALKKYKEYIPSNIGLLGFDNIEWSTLSAPTVTTIVQPAYEEGEHAALILIDSIEGIHEELPNQILRCSVQEGESTAV